MIEVKDINCAGLRVSCPQYSHSYLQHSKAKQSKVKQSTAQQSDIYL